MHKFLSLCTFLLVSLLFIDTAQAQCSLGGPSSIPQGQTRTYTATAQGGASYFWSTTGGLAIVGSNRGSSVTVRGNGTGRVCFTRFRNGSEPCSRCRTITVASPCPTSIPITSFVECIGNRAIVDLTARPNPVPSVPVTYSWTVLSGPGNLLGTPTTASAAMIAPANSSTTVRVTITCQGGTITGTRTVRVGRCSGIPLDAPLAFPNPVDNSLKIKLQNNAEVKSNSAYTIEIINKKGEMVLNKALKGNNQQIDVSKLSEGLYFLRTKLNGKVISTDRLMKK